MSNYSTDANVLEYEPQIKEYGILDFTDDHTKTTADIQRYLRIHWWPRVSRTQVRYFNTSVEMDNTKLSASQFTRAAVFHVLAYYFILQDGVKYDFDGDSTVEDNEQQPVHFNRLVR